MTDLRHPVPGALHATVPGGLLVLAVMTSVVGPDIVPTRTVVALATVLAVAGGVLAIVVSPAFTSVLFTGEPTVTALNGGWFIPRSSWSSWPWRWRRWFPARAPAPPAAGLYLALLGCWTVVATKAVAATRSGRVWQR